MPIEYLDDIEEDITEAADTTPVEQPPVAGVSEPVAPEPSGEFGGRIEYIEEEPLEIEPPRDNSWDTLRGFEVSMRQVPQLAYGVAGLVGETAEQLTGYGESLRDWGFRGYQDWAESMEPISKETDDVTVAWQKAKEGDIGALVDWAQYGIGYALGQLGETAAIAVLGGIAGGAAGAAGGPTAVPAAAGGAVVAAAGKTGFKALAKNLVEKAISAQAKNIVKKQAAKEGIELTGEQLAKRAQQEAIKRQAGREIGSNAAVFANAIGMQLGAIYGSAEEKAREEGRELTGLDLARIWGSGIATGGLEGVVDKFGLDLLKGKFAEALPAGRLAGAAVAGPIGLVGEAATEAVQTVGERFGAGRELLSDEAINEYINASALGGIGGGVIGGAGGFISGNPKENAAAKAKVSSEANKDIAPATAETVARQADAVIAETVQETPEQRVARLQEESAAAAGIELEEEGEGGVEPTVPVTPPVAPTPEGAVAPVEPVVTPEVAEPQPAAEVAPTSISESEQIKNIKDKGVTAIHFSRTPMQLEKGVDISKIKGAYPEESVFGRGFYAMEPADESSWRSASRFQLGDYRNEVKLSPKNPIIISPDTVKKYGYDEIKNRVDQGGYDAIIVSGWNPEYDAGIEKRLNELWSPVFPEGRTSGQFLNTKEYDAAISRATEEITGLSRKDYEAISKSGWDQNQVFIPPDIASDIVSKPEVTPPAEVAPEVTPNLEPLRRVARAEQAPEDIPSLVEAGLVEVYKDQPVITEAGIAQLPEAERPRLTPEARKIQIDTGANEVVAEAISKNLRIGVDQVGANVRMPAGWTLVEDIYVPPAKQEVAKAGQPEQAVTPPTLKTKYTDNNLENVSFPRTSGQPNQARQALEVISKGSSPYAQLAQEILNAASTNPEISFAISNSKFTRSTPAQDRGRFKNRSFYEAAYRTIAMNPNQAGDTRIAVHEIIHAIIAHKLPNQISSSKLKGKKYKNVLDKAIADKSLPKPLRDIIRGYILTVEKMGAAETLWGTGPDAGTTSQTLNVSVKYLGAPIGAQTKAQREGGRSYRIQKKSNVQKLLRYLKENGITEVDVRQGSYGIRSRGGQPYYDVIIANSDLEKIAVNKKQQGKHPSYYGNKGYDPTNNALTWNIKNKKFPLANDPDAVVEYGFEYGLGNIDEFLSEALSNPEFQKVLNEIEMEQGKTIWQTIVDAIARILGIEVKAGSVLDVISRSAFELATEGDLLLAGGRTPSPAPEVRESRREPAPLTQQDREYLDAVERGDLDAASRVVDAAAQAAGNVTTAYRSNTQTTTVFDTKNRAAWFTDDLTDAQDYASITDVDPETVSKYYLNTDNFASLDDPQIARQIRDIVPNMNDLMAVSDAMPQIRQRLGERYDGIKVTSFSMGYETTHYNPFKPERIKSADAVTRDDQGNIIPPSQRFQPTEEDIRYSRREPVLLKNRFYSQLERTVAAKMPNVSSPEQLKAIIDPSRGSGVKPEEIKWSGITEAIDRIAAENNGRVPKEAIIKYMQDEGNVRFEEVTLARKKVPYTGGEIKRMPNGTYKLSFFGYDSMYTKLEDAESDLQKMREGASRTEDETTYSQYQLPNGENYREVILTTASGGSYQDPQRLRDLSRERRGIQESGRMLTREESNRITEIDKEVRTLEDRIEQAKSKYKSPHFANIPNYVAHMRLNDRKDAEGKDGTFIEEIQSDLHQKAREVGYKDEGIVQQNFVSWLAANKKELSEQEIQTQFKTRIGEEIQQWTKDQEIAAKNASAVPDAPFRKDWSLQMFKRALEEAVASGKDWIGWTTGDTQAARYDLSKQAKAVIYNKNRDGSFTITVRDLNDVNSKIGDYSAEKLPDVVGKELAEKIVNDPNPNGIFAGNDLKIGGEGMKGFYDNILPKEIAKYVKKWGATVEKSEISAGVGINAWVFLDDDGVFRVKDRKDGKDPQAKTLGEFDNQTDAEEFARMYKGENVPIWRVSITPEMRRIIEEEGQALFSLQMPSRIAGMEPEAVTTKLESLGFGRGGIVSVVNEPDASFEGRTIIRDGKVVGIELNAAALRDDAAVERVLNHEIAESANADGALNRLVAGLTPKERKEINDAITRLGYAERARTAEEAARAVELLAEGWRGRRWFERAVARIEAWANKLGYKLTRRAAEYIAARNMAEVNDSFKQAYNKFINVQGEAREARVGEQAVVDADMGRRSQTELTPQEIEQLESGEKIRVYRAMQVIDGKLYPPMSALVGGKLRKPTEIGTWEKAEERPDLLDKRGKFILQKGNKATVPAAYNPYFHTSTSPLNDQFSSAYKRDNLVTVEVEVPASELTSGYKADGAKDAVGEVRWNAGPVSSKLPADKKRKVILSRYAKVVRIVPDSEVAGIIANLLEGTNLSIPENTVTPSLKAELEKQGISVTPRPVRGEEIRESRREDAIPTFSEGSPEASTLSTMASSMAKVDAASEAKPNPENKPTYKISEIASVWMDQGGDARQLQDMVVEYTNLTPANAKKVANAIAKQYDIQQSIATAFLETPAGISVEALPEGVTLPKEVDPDRPRPVMQRLFDVFMGVRVKPVKITGDEKALLKSQIRLKAAANRAAKQEQQRTADEVVEIIKSMELRGPVRPKQAQALAKRAAKVIWTSEKSMETFVEYAAKVVENANYDADLREAKAAQKRAKELSKQKKVAMSPQRLILQQIGNVAVNKLDDPRMFAEMINYYLRGFKDVRSPDYVVVPDEEITGYISQLENESVTDQAEVERETNERLARKYDLDPNTIPELMSLINIIEEIEGRENREALESILTDKAIETQDGLRGYDTTALTNTQKKLVESMLNVDLKSINTQERQMFIRIANNMIYNNQTNGAEYFVATAKGQENARKAARDSKLIQRNQAWIPLIPSFGSLKLQETLRNFSLELQSVADTFRNVFGKDFMAKAYEMMGMLDLNEGFTKANNTIDEIQDLMAEFHQGNKKKYGDAARNQDGILSEGVAGFLIQEFPFKDEATSIQQRRNLINEYIANARESRQKDRVAMADRVETILNKIDGASVQEILNNMKREYRPNYDSLMWYKDVLFPKYKDFLKQFDENFNDQANNYDSPNYLPIAFTSAGPALALTTEDVSIANSISLQPKQSVYTIKRQDYTTLPKDRDGNPKEIEFNLRRNAFNSLSDQINKAYTNPSWQQIFAFMKTPESIEFFGDKANRDFFVDRLNRLRVSRARRGSVSGGGLEKALDSLSIISRKLGTGIALGGAFQWIKQPPDQLLTALGSGGRGDLLAKNIAPSTQKAARELLNLFSIGRRGDSSAGYKYINQMEGHQSRMERYFSESKWEQAKEQGGKIADVWMVALKKSDFISASAAWMTYYEGELNKNDIKIDDWAKEAELVKTDPVRRQAAAYAEQMTDIYQGSSDPTSMATFAQSGKTGWENFVKALLVPFNSFAVQQRMRLYSDARDALNGTSGGKGGLAGTIGGLILFHTTKRFVLPVISGGTAAVLYGMLGVDMEEPDEEKQKEMADRNWRQFLADITGNLLVGGTPQIVENRVIESFNYASYMVGVQLESETVMDENGEIMSFDKYSKERSPFYRYKSYDNAMSLGMFEIGFDQAKEAALQTKMLMDREEMEMYTPEEQRLLYFSALSEWLYLMRLNDTDFARIVKKARRDMIKAAEEREKELARIRAGR